MGGAVRKAVAELKAQSPAYAPKRLVNGAKSPVRGD
jgi:hypothetical protein